MKEAKEIDISDEEVKSRFGEIEKEEYLDPRFGDVRRTRALLLFWNSTNNDLVSAREGFHLAEKWKDDNLAKQNLDSGRILLKRINVIEEELRLLLPTIKSIRFLTDSELLFLPLWMSKLLEIKVEKVTE